MSEPAVIAESLNRGAKAVRLEYGSDGWHAWVRYYQETGQQAFVAIVKRNALIVPCASPPKPKRTD